MQARPDKFLGPVNCAYKTVSEEGVLALWKGSRATLTGMVMENAAAFAVNEQLKRIFPASPESEGTLSASEMAKGVVLGSITGIVTAAVLCPAEVIKTKTQVAMANHKLGDPPAPNEFKMLRAVWSKQGPRGFYTGLEAQAMRDGPFYAVFFGSYEISVHLLRQYTLLPDEATFFISGGIAGMVGWGAVIPFDGPKSIIQVICGCSSACTRHLKQRCCTAFKRSCGIAASGATTAAAISHPHHRHRHCHQASWTTGIAGDFGSTFRTVVRERGLGGLYAGFAPAMCRAFPANAALFLGYEMTKRGLNDVEEMLQF